MWMSVGVLALNRRCTFWQPRSRVETITADSRHPHQNWAGEKHSVTLWAGMAWEEESRVIIVGVAWADQLTKLRERWAAVQQTNHTSVTTQHHTWYYITHSEYGKVGFKISGIAWVDQLTSAPGKMAEKINQWLRRREMGGWFWTRNEWQNLPYIYFHKNK